MKPRELKVLVVDDNASDRLIVGAILRKLKARVVQEAEHGSIAEAKIHNALEMNEPFDLLILDWNMPNANGLQLLHFLRKNIRERRRPKVIIMTASAEQDVVETAVAHGADDFIVKPVEEAVLAQKIDKL